MYFCLKKALVILASKNGGNLPTKKQWMIMWQ